jgi:hypothetical protein
MSLNTINMELSQSMDIILLLNDTVAVFSKVFMEKQKGYNRYRKQTSLEQVSKRNDFSSHTFGKY